MFIKFLIKMKKQEVPKSRHRLIKRQYLKPTVDGPWLSHSKEQMTSNL